MNATDDKTTDLTALINRIENGDPEAFGLLFERYKNLVYRTAALMLDDPMDAEDVLQEVFVQVHRHLSGYQPEKGAITTWLYAITANLCKNRRRVKSILAIPLDWIDNLRQQDDLAVESTSDQSRAVQQALENMNAKIRDVLILRYYSALPYAEIAQVLGIPIGTVQSRLNWGLKKLRQEIEANDPDLFLDDMEVIQ